jgi:flavin reductase ActVB
VAPIVSEPTPAARRALREAMTRFASGVAIVTTRDRSASDWGMTVTAFSPVSLTPPLVLACLATAAGSTQAFVDSDRFAISVLRGDQEDLALRFATGRPDKFILGGFGVSPTGLRVVEDAIAVLECRTERVVPGGDHAIVVGAVEEASSAPGPALVYLGREFVAVAPEG